MTNSPPKDPKVDDIWLNDAGELHYWDGKRWALYDDPPEWPGDDPDPKWLYRDA
jgi:hypothetical protein